MFSFFLSGVSSILPCLFFIFSLARFSVNSNFIGLSNYTRCFGFAYLFVGLLHLFFFVKSVLAGECLACSRMCLCGFVNHLIMSWLLEDAYCHSDSVICNQFYKITNFQSNLFKRCFTSIDLHFTNNINLVKILDQVMVLKSVKVEINICFMIRNIQFAQGLVWFLADMNITYLWQFY